MAIVSATSPSITYSGIPPSQWPPSLKCSSWASAMTIARPLTKPSITGCGTMRTSLPSRSRPKAAMISPPSSTVASRYCTPCCTTRATITTAIEPAAPETMPGRPPNSAVRVQRMKAPYSPISGLRWATRAKAMHSGTRAKDVVSPARTSARRRTAFIFLLGQGNAGRPRMVRKCALPGQPRRPCGTQPAGVCVSAPCRKSCSSTVAELELAARP